MTGTVEEYQDALRDYEVAELAAHSMIAAVRALNDCLGPSKFYSFIGWAFNIGDQIEPGGRFEKSARFDLGSWPSAEQFGTVIRKWHDAWEMLHKRWNALPEERRRGFKSPPAKMNIYSLKA